MRNKRICPQCGTERTDDSLGGLCPKCLARYSFLELVGEAGGVEPKEGPEGTVKVEPEKDVEPERTGMMIGRYKLLEQIGEGGFGVVYMAEQVEPVQRKVALKVIKAGMDTREVIARFEAERQALALMDHPNIARVLDAGTTKAGRPYFVMDLVRGIPITEFCDQRNLDTTERLCLFIQVCHAVQHAHQKGIIHRDLKPSNILVTLHDGEPVPEIIDFGVAKALGQRLTEKTLLTGFAHMLGTPAYMSPEQAELSGLDIDTRSDIYSLGVLLYELLTGVTPFDAETLRKAALDEVRRMIREKDPPRPSTRLQTLGDELTDIAKHRHIEPPKLINSMRGDLDWIVMQCLEKDRRRRYETANGLAMDVQRHLDDEPVLASPPGRLYKLRKTIRRHKFGFAAAAALILIMALGVAASTWQAVRATRAEQVARTEAARSEQVAQFMKDMLEGVGPSVAMGRDTRLLEEILDQTMERLVGEDLAAQPAVQAELLTTMGEVYRAIDELDKAAVAQRRALSIRQKLYGDTPHPDVATSLDCLSRVLWKQRDLQESEALQREALLMRQELFGEKSPEVALSWFYLGRVIHVQQPYRETEAEAAYRTALAILETMPGHELVRAKVWRNLSGSLRKQGDIEGAKRALREALRICEGIPDVRVMEELGIREMLARILEQDDELGEAERLYREVIDAQIELLGDDHSHVGQVVGYLTRLLERQGRIGEVTTFYSDLADQGSSMAQNNLAWLMATHPDPEIRNGHKAVDYAERAVAATGRENYTYMDTLAAAYAEADQFTNAVRVQQEAIALLPADRENLRIDFESRLRLFESNSPYREYWREANRLQTEGKSAEAEALLRQELAMRRRMFDAGHPNIASTLASLSQVLLEQHKYDEAEPLARECLAVREEKLPDDWLMFNARSLLGGSLLGQKEYEKAEPLLLSGYEGMQEREDRIPAAGKVRIKEALERLVQLYDESDQPDLAAEWKQKLAEFDQAGE